VLCRVLAGGYCPVAAIAAARSRAADGALSNPAITGLLLEHGARPDDHVLYLAAFETSHGCLRLLLPYAPISTGDVAGARLLLDAGADPNRLLDAGLLSESHEQEPAVPPLSAAVDLESGSEMVGLLLERAPTPTFPAGTAAPPTSRPSAQGMAR
jgi:hypothetical protein